MRLLKVLIVIFLSLSACKTLDEKISVIEINKVRVSIPPSAPPLTYEEFLRTLSNEEFEIYIKNLRQKYNWGQIYPIKRSTRDDYT